jgi:hypothetical protein
MICGAGLFLCEVKALKPLASVKPPYRGRNPSTTRVNTTPSVVISHRPRVLLIEEQKGPRALTREGAPYVNFGCGLFRFLNLVRDVR